MTGHVPTICQVLHSLNVGGAEVLAYRLAKRLRERYRFVFACLDDLGPLGEELRAAGSVVEVLARKSGFDFACARRLAQFARHHDVDLLHAHQYTPFCYSIMPTSWRRRPPVLFTEHGRWHPDHPRMKRILFNRLLLARRDRVVGVGESVRQALIRNEGLPARRVGVIYNGVDLDRFETSTEDRVAARRELGLDDDSLAIIQVARLDGLKDHATAIRTIERVAAVVPNARLLLVGEGPERAMIEQEVDQRNVRPFVRLLGLRQDIPRLLVASDLFLLTSISEGIPVTLIEAMGCRLPVVSTSVGGVAEVVEAEATGLLAPAGDDRGLADAVISLSRDPTRRAAMGESGRQRAKRLFSEEQMHAQYEATFQSMLTGS